MTVSYTVPTLNPIQDEAGNDAAALSDQAVTNLVTAPPMITSVAITSDPGADKTYAIGDDIVVTVTFDKNITLGPGTGIPYIQLRIGTETQERECPIGTDTKTMVCTFTVEESEDHEDTDGIGIGPNLAVLGKSILGPLGQTADRTFAALPADSDHKVDGVKPTLTTTGVSSDDTKIILTFSEAIGTVDRTKITLMSGTNTLTATADSINEATVEITLTTALTAADIAVTVALDADAVTDVPGNGIDAVAETSVSRVDTTAPALTAATTVSNNVVLLTYNEALDSTSIPDKSRFTVKVGGTARTVAAVGTNGTMGITLTLGSTFRPGDTLTVSYAVPSTNPIQDASNNEAAAFTDEAVTNNLAATAPDAPGNLAASPGTVDGTMELTWDTPWANGSDITEFEVRHAAGTSVPPTTTWDDITGSGAGTTSHTVTGLAAGTEYTFEVRAVNGIGNAAASVTATLLAPVWEFTLTDSGGDPVTELTEGGDPATATVSITNSVRFGTNQTVTLKHGVLTLDLGLIRGDGDATTITITSGQSSGSLEISAPDLGGTDIYQSPFTFALTATHGGTEIGSIDLTRLDDEEPPVASITDAPTTVSEGGNIEVEITLTPAFGANATINFAVTDADSALTGTLPTSQLFSGGQARQTITLTTDDNTTQNDGARDVTLTLALNDDFPYTLGTTSSVTVEVLDDDTPPSAPRSLMAEARLTEVDLTWQAPATDHGQPLTYEYRQQEGTGSFGDWTAILNSDIDTTGYTVTGLTSGADYTFEVRAENVGGKGNEASVIVTTLAPTWELTLTDSNGDPVTQLTEGGDPATATVRITNTARFGTEQTVQLKHGTLRLFLGLIRGAGEATTITIPANGDSGSLEISVVDNEIYDPPFTRALTATHGGTEIGSIDLGFVDDESVPVATISMAPTTVDEGESIEVEFTLTPATISGWVNLSVTDADGALSGTLPTSGQFLRGDTDFTVTLTADDNSVQNDGAREVTVALALNPDIPYTLGTTSSVTIEVRDDDTPPTAPRNLTAQAGNTTARLTWQAPAPPVPDHGQPVLHYEYQVKVGSGSFSSWAPIPNGAAASTTVTPIVGVGVSFGAAALSVDEGDLVTVTVTLGAVPAASVTVPITATPGAGLEANEYAGVPSSVSFNAGDVSQSFTVTTVEDMADEPDAVLTLAFGPLPAGYILGTHAELALTVVDDDVPIVSATFDQATATASEGGSVAVTVRLSQAPEREVVLPLVATPGANLDADEYEGVPANVAIAADATQARFTVAFADDAVEEGNETLTLTFGARPAGVTSGANPQLVLTVTDDDGPPAAPDVSAQTGDGFVTLSWDPVANDSPILRYEVRVDGGAWQSVGLETSYQYEDLENGREYTFDVRAVNAHGNGDEASAPGTPSQVLTRIPTAVQVLNVKATDSGRAELSWIRPANGTDKDHNSSNPNSTMSQLQGYRIDVCRTACDDEANWYAVVPNTRKFEHQYVHQVLAPGVIRENRYRVRAININGKPGPWSNVATLAPTVLENVRLQTPDDSTLRVRFKVRNPDGNPLHVRYGNTGPVDADDGNTGTGTVGYAERRLTKAGDVTLELTGLDAGSWYRVDLDFADTFDSARMQSHRHGTARAGKTPLKSPYAVDALDAQVFAGGVWRDAPDTQLGVRMGGTGRYRLRLKPCDGERTVIVRRIQSPAGRLQANPMAVDPSLLDLACNGDDPSAWREVTATALALEGYPADRRWDALLSAPFAVVHNHEVWRDTSATESTLVSEGTGLVRVAVERPAGATLPEPTGVAIADPAAGGNPVMRWDAVPGATAYLVNWRHGPHYRSGANADRRNQTGTSTALPFGGSRRGPITARVRAYSASGVSGWVERTWDSRPPTLNVLDTAVNEDDGSVGFLVKLDPAASGTVTVDYATADDTAVAGTDYTATSGTVTFAPGEREKATALVPIVDDGEEDSGETFRLLLSNPTGSDADNGAAVLGDAEAVATILNSEREAARLTGFTLVDAGTNADLMVLADGATVALGELPARSYGIRAETSAGAAPGSVRLALSGAKTVTHADDAAPYSLYGDGGGRLNGGSLPAGSYTLTATAYADSGGRGDEQGSLEVSFAVTAGALGTTTPGPFAVAEGATAVATLAASETGTGETATWSIPAGTAGGADGEAFALTADGVLSLVAAKDFEAPDDADGDGTYEVTVEVRAGAQTATADLAVALTDVNEAPVAKAAAAPGTVREGVEVTLDGSASTDPDADDTLGHAWTQAEGGPRVTLSDAAAAQPTFTSPSDLAAQTELAFTLRVTDAAGLHAEDTATVTVTLVSEVSIAAAADYPVEGDDAVFRLTRAGSALAALTVPVSVEETGAMLGSPVPAGATFAAGARETEYRVPTAADAVSENDSRVTARLASGSGWQLAPGAVSAALTVLDDDAAPVASTSAADVTVWSADMTVVEYGPRSIGAGSADLFSNQQGRAGLRAKWLWYDPPARKLKLGFDDGLDDAEALTLHVGDVSLRFPDNTGGNSSFSLEDVDVAWTDGGTVAARVSKPAAAAVSTDATLASLSVSGATLDPAFDAAVLVYGATVDADAATVAATANDGGAALTYGPAADADAALADYQVATPAGETLVEVTVTAADGTVRRYRVVLARATDAANTAPTGLPVTSGTPKVDEELTVSADDIADADGLDNATFAWQWLADDGTTATPIAGATGDSWTLKPAEAGRTIRVRATFTDDKGTQETLSSVATDEVAARANRPATGAPAIAGTPRTGETLTADTSAIADADGLDNATYAYQWVSNDGADDTDIQDATGASYELTDAEQGRTVKVRVTFTDDKGHEETLVSVATQTIAARPNATPAGAPTISGTERVGETLTADTSAIADADGLDNATYAYQWIANDGTADADIADRTQSTYTLAGADEGMTIKVRVTFTDDKGTQETLVSVATETIAARPNAAPAGAPTISGTERVDETLTADTSAIADDDGLDNASYAYQWIANDGTVDADIADGTQSTYTLAGADEGKTIKVRVTFTDDGGTQETLVSVATQAIAARPKLTATFAEVPDSHDGTAFVFYVQFSEDPAVSYLVLRDDSFDVTGGTVVRAKRKDGRDDLREIHVAPSGYGEVTVSLPATTDCDASGAICTADERPLSSTLTTTVAGPAGLSVADARATEGSGASVDFAVSLSRSASATVTVDYATRDGTATAGADYTATSGTLTFEPGERAGTVSVPVLDDLHDDAGETFALVLANASGAYLSVASATGTIDNADPIPQAWLVRFGRTAADHAVEAIGGRFEEQGGGSHATFAGRRLRGGGSGPEGLDDASFGRDPWGAADALGVAGDGPGDRRGFGGHTLPGIGQHGAPGGMPGAGPNAGTNSGMDIGIGNTPMHGPSASGGHRRTLHDLLIGSSFRLSVGDDGDDGRGARRLTGWGRAAATRFDGTADGVSMDGEAATFLLGADAAWDKWLAGVSVAHTAGAGSFRGVAGGGTGELDSTLTAVHPYLRYRATDRLSAWGVLGYGRGDLTLATAGSAWRTDTAMRMAAAGARGVLLRGAGGLELAARMDARLTRIVSDAAVGESGLLGATAGGTSRVRLLLEGSRTFAFGGTRRLTPTLEVGVRRDGGDAETGTGIDLGGTLRYADAGLGLTAEASGRYLVAHEDDAYREWGASASVRIDPGRSGHGLTVAFAPSWGAAATGGAERLWSLADARGLARGGYAANAGMRLDADVGYGLAGFRGRGALLPFAGLRLTGPGRDWRTGLRWTLGEHTSLALEAMRRESAMAPPGHGIALKAALRR